MLFVYFEIYSCDVNSLGGVDVTLSESTTVINICGSLSRVSLQVNRNPCNSYVFVSLNFKNLLLIKLKMDAAVTLFLSQLYIDFYQPVICCLNKCLFCTSLYHSQWMLTRVQIASITDTWHEHGGVSKS